MRPPGGDARQRLGRRGEELAATALSRAGLQVVERRFRLRHGEIDLIAEDDELLVFVEVKARSGRGFGIGEAVTPAKQRTLARVALAYLVSRGMTDRPCRFDVVEVLEPEGGQAEVRHIVDAFRPQSDPSRRTRGG